MHYSQGRDRWFGQIQSAPTVDGNAIHSHSRNERQILGTRPYGVFVTANRCKMRFTSWCILNGFSIYSWGESNLPWRVNTG